MRIIDMKCSNCGAILAVDSEKREANCEHCGAKFLIDDENIHVDFDAEQAGYDFEKGRQRAQEEAAQEEAAQEDYADPEEEYVEEYEEEIPKTVPVSARDSVSSSDAVNKSNSGSKAPIWIALGLLLLFLIFILGKCGSKANTPKDTNNPNEVAVEAVEEAEAVEEVEVAEESEASNEGILDVEAEELAEEPAALDGEPANSAETDIKGRGFCDEDYKEPDYVGLSGYVAIYKNDEPMLSLYEIPAEPWYVPKYAKYEGKFIDTEDKVEHKTAIKVLGQELKYEDVAKYGGYLLVEDESGEQFYIDVDNFVTKDYWNETDLSKALETGYYIAVYHQKSDISPVNHDNEEMELEDGTLVFVRNFVPGEWSVNVNKPHPDTTPIEGLVWGGWFDVNEYGAVGVCFNAEDLEILY